LHTKEKSGVKKCKEVGVTVLLDIFQVLVDLRQWLDEKLTIVWGIEDTEESIPHALASLQ
jgi:hypothetical protein